MREALRLKAIDQAISYAVAAGRLRTAIREHGSGLRGLERLADRYSDSSAEALDGVGEGRAKAPSPREETGEPTSARRTSTFGNRDVQW